MKRPYAEQQLRAFRSLAVKTPGGLYLGNQAAFLVDDQRISRTLRRYVEGLYFWETKTRLLPLCEFTVQPNPEAVLQDWPQIFGLIGGTQPVVVQPGVFGYRWVRASGNPNAMIWLLVFFDALPFLAVAADQERFAALQQRP
jgi:hypothetical protein